MANATVFPLLPPSSPLYSLPQMSPSLFQSTPDGGDGDDCKATPSYSESGRGGTAMRLIVPLQSVVQGRGGLVLGSVIPCALFYFLQLYLRRKRPSPSSPSPSTSSGDLPELDGIARTQSRNVISPRTVSSPALVSSRAASVNKSDGYRLDLGHMRCLEDAYHPSSNPNGVIQLGLSENQLSLDLVREWMERNVNASLLEEGKEALDVGGMAAYSPHHGLLDLKIVVASFMGQVMRESVSFNPSQILLTAGAASAIETLCFCLADPGNAILVPSPYDPGYDKNIKWRTGVHLIPVPCRSTENFNISIAALERAYNQAKKRGVKVRALLISNPSNPVGNLWKKDAFYDLLVFTTEKNIHLISDELFVGSVYGDKQFMSIAEFLDAEDFDKSRVHIIYRLSEDLSLPSFHIAVIYSLNDNVLVAAAKFARFSSISFLGQRLLALMLTDKWFISELLQLSRKRLKSMHHLLVEGLKSLDISCAEGGGGFVSWVDMSKFLRSYSAKGELEMWEQLLDIAKINATPGSSCHCIEPGWFQFCFTTLSESGITVVIERVKKFIEGHNAH